MAEPVAITVLMPAYNAARWLRASVQSVLAQRGVSFELLVVDDGSTDGTAELLASLAHPRLRVLRQAQNQGLIAALNRGLAEARGEYVARLDADDLCKPERLARQYAALRGDGQAQLVAGWSELIDPHDRHLGWSRWQFSPEAYYYLLHFRNCIGHSTVMFRRDAVLQAGGYRPAYRHAEDFELWARLAKRGKLLLLLQVVTAYRVHEASVSARQASQQADMAARIAGEQLSSLLDEPADPLLSTLHSERAFSVAGDLSRAARQLAEVHQALWRARPSYVRDDVLRQFMQVEWSRRAVSFARRGVVLEGAHHALARARVEGTLRGVLDELRLPRIERLLPRTHP